MTSSFEPPIHDEILQQTGALRSEWRWVADRSRIGKDKQSVLAALDAAAAERGYYIKGDVRPSALTHYLPKICLFDPIYDVAAEPPVDGMIRLMGTWVERFYGRRTGRKFSEAVLKAVGQRQLASIQTSWQGRRPGRSLAWGHSYQGIGLVVDAMYVPLMDADGGNVAQFLVHVDVVPETQFEDN
ncbi:hypothetical protein [Gimibacter soli]|uniref:Uncharacterized protein n=1 Tax=Gimibacter soli TaxID=3024400 RepID=A0AAE9XVC8_9PROT|nr:hypothetical protein [Gimibacter soli]WCL53559.1 hypothetical protein PH603_13550 [Gimibacter soli]